jgi:hypothetical protein
MSSIRILGTDIKVEFLVGKNPEHEMDEDAILARLGEMAELINGKEWPSEFADAFRIMNKIVFFEGMVVVDGHELTRPGCDQDDAIFYWEANEFTANPDADVHGNTFFHDCWHVVQFRRAGNKFALGDTEPVEREVDAINQQIEVGKILGNDARELKFLEDFRDNQQAIKDRLREGIGKGGPHPTGFPPKD